MIKRCAHTLLAVTIALTCVGWSGAAMAQSDPAESLLQEGLVNFRVGKFSDALKVFDKAKRKAKETAVKARVNMYRGLVLGVMGKESAARKAFTEALKADPTVAPKEGEAKKKVLAMFHDVRAGLKGRLEVKADREGALVYLGDKEAGKTPFAGEVPVGKYKVVINTPDDLYRHEAEVVVKLDDVATLEVKLPFVGSRLNLTTRPAGAKVTLDGKDAGVTPVKDHPMRTGGHKLEVALDGHQAVTRMLKARPGESLTLDLELKPGSATAAAPTPAPTDGTTPDPKPEPEPEPGDSSFHFPVYTAIAGGAALAALAAGIALSVSANNAYDEFETTQDLDRYNELKDQIPGLELGANISFGVAGAAAVGAVLLYLFVDRPAAQDADAEATANLILGPTGAALKVTF